MANAQWAVQFHVAMRNKNTDEIETTFNHTIYLASPDLLNTKEAHKRARVTARARFDKWMEKNYKFSATRRATIQCVECRCVG